jgi:hypothetical protein
MFGPLGAAIGGVIGGAMSAFEHWDELTDDVASAYSFVANAASGGLSWFTSSVSSVWGGAKDFANSVGTAASVLWDKGITGAREGYGWVTTMAGKGLKNYTDSVSGFWNGFMNYDYSGMVAKIGEGAKGVKDMISGIIDKIGGWIGDLFTWIGDFLTGDSALAKLVGMTTVGAAVIAAVKTNRSDIKPTEEGRAAAVNVDAMQNQIAVLQLQQQQILKENSELKAKLDQLLTVLSDSANNQTVGMIEMIALTKKGNKELVTSNRE